MLPARYDDDDIYLIRCTTFSPNCCNENFSCYSNTGNFAVDLFDIETDFF